MGSGAGEGRDWLCSPAPSAGPGVQTRASQAQCRLSLTPGRGEINKWGSLPRRSLSLEGSPDFARGTVRFRVVSQCSQQRALSLGTALGLRRRKGEQPANFQVGKEGGEGGGEQLAGGLQTVKFALPPGRDLPEQRNYTTSLGKARLCFPKPTLFPAHV